MRYATIILVLILFIVGPLHAQDPPLTARSDAPIVQRGDTLTFEVTIGSQAEPVTNLYGVAFQLTFDPDDFVFTGFQPGPLFASELQNFTAFQFLRGPEDSDGDGTPDATEDGFVAYSVTLSSGAEKTSTGGQPVGRFTFAVRDTAETGTPSFSLQDADRNTSTDPEIEITNVQGETVEISTTERARRQSVAAGDPPAVRFPALGGLTVDFSSLNSATELTVGHPTMMPGGTDLPNGSDDYQLAVTGFWQLAQSGATDFTAEVCIPFDLVTNELNDNDALRLVKRPDGTQPWTILTTTLKPDAGAPQEACASVTSFSDLTAAAPAAALPVELASFEATADGADAVRLSWETAGETNNARFEVQRRTAMTSSRGRPTWQTIGTRQGAGTTAEAQRYSFTDGDLPFEAKRVRYRLRQVDRDGAETLSEERAVTLDGPQAFALHGAFPNPFREAAVIRYELPAEQRVVIAVYDVLGREVETLVDEQQHGRQQIRFEASGLPAGLYFYRVTAGRFTETRRMVHLR